MILSYFQILFFLNENSIRCKVILICIGIIIALTAISNNLYAISTPISFNCNIVKNHLCFSVGSNSGKMNHGTICPKDQISKFCNAWNNSIDTIKNNYSNDRYQNSSGSNRSPSNQTNGLSHFDINNFKIITFGVKNHNPFVIVQGNAGGTRGDESGYNELGYIFYTNKGLFGAFSAFPDQLYMSSHFTQKNIKGNACLDKSHTAGHVIINGHKLTISDIDINKVDKVLTELSFVDSDNGNCINTVYDIKP